MVDVIKLLVEFLKDFAGYDYSHCVFQCSKYSHSIVAKVFEHFCRDPVDFFLSFLVHDLKFVRFNAGPGVGRSGRGVMWQNHIPDIFCGSGATTRDWPHSF